MTRSRSLASRLDRVEQARIAEELAAFEALLALTARNAR